MSVTPGRRGIATGDVLLVLAGLALVGALAYPWISWEMTRRRAAGVIDAVESLRGAARRYYEIKNGWPPEAEPGEIPTELAPFVPADLVMTAPSHALDWDEWETVTLPKPPANVELEPPGLDEPPRTDVLKAPPPVFGDLVGITVHTRDPRVLGLLLDHYGRARSFVRDSTWTLLLQRPDSAG